MTAPPSAPELVGFRFIEVLGSGGFADVFKYEQLGLDRQVAVKVLRRGLGDTALGHFRSEANLMAKLSNHPSIVSIYQAGAADDGRPYLVMEYCPPPHLGTRIRKRPLPIGKALEVAVQLAGAVETAHRLGILHRDIKPANILFTEFGRPALTDFGISSSAGSAATAAAFSPAWAPPEQIANQPMGPPGDVYSLGATVWAMLVGRSPFAVPGAPTDDLAMVGRVKTMPVPGTGRADVPESLERLLRVAMAKDPARRYGSALELARALQGVQTELLHSVTPLDIRQDGVADDDTQMSDDGTRVTGFFTVDPDGPSSHTLGVVHDLGGTTHPTGGRTDGSWGRRVAEVPAGGPPILWHGRGSRPAAGPLEFTGPAIPVLSPLPTPAATPTTAGPPGADDAAAAAGARRSRRRPVMVGAVVVLTVSLGGWWAVTNGADAPPNDAATSAVAAPQDPVGGLVPRPGNPTAERVGGDVVVAWDNPSPEEGDYFHYRVLVLGEDPPWTTTSEPTVTVPAETAKTCVEIVLVRADRRYSRPATACTEDGS